MASDKVGFSPDGRYVWSIGHDPTTPFHVGDARRWEISTGGYAGQAVGGPDAAISASGEIVLNGGADKGWVQRIDSETPLAQWPGWSIAHAISPDGQLAATMDREADGHSYDLVVRSLPEGVEKFRTRQSHDVPSAGFSPDGHHLVTNEQNGTEVRVWDTSTHQTVWHEGSLGGGGNILRFSSDGSRFLRWSTESELDVARIYQTRTGRMFTLIRAGGNFVAAEISPDGRFVLFSDAKHPGSLRMWDVEGDKEISDFKLDAQTVTSVAVSPDSGHALIGLEDGSLRLLALPGGSEIHRFTGHTGKVTAIAFSADGKLAASGSADLTVRVRGLP